MAEIDYDLLRRLGLLPSEFGTGGELPSFPMINVGPRFGPQLEDAMSPPFGNLPPALGALAQGATPAGEDQAPLDAPQQPGQTTQRFPWVSELPGATQFDKPMRVQGQVPVQTQNGVSSLTAPEGTASWTPANPADTQNWIAKKLQEQTEQRAAADRRVDVETRLALAKQREAEQAAQQRQMQEQQLRTSEAGALQGMAQSNPAAFLEFMSKKRNAAAVEGRAEMGGTAEAQAFREVARTQGLPAALEWLKQDQANKQTAKTGPQTPEMSYQKSLADTMGRFGPAALPMRNNVAFGGAQSREVGQATGAQTPVGPTGTPARTLTTELGQAGRPLDSGAQTAISALQNIDQTVKELRSKYSPEEIKTFTGLLKFQGQKAMLPFTEDKRFADFAILNERLRGTAFGEGGKQLTPFEASVVFGYTPTGRELSSTEYLSKIENLERRIPALIENRVRLAKTPRGNLGAGGGTSSPLGQAHKSRLLQQGAQVGDTITLGGQTRTLTAEDLQ
jgi:hypothetical protein